MICSAAGPTLLFLLAVLQIHIIVDLLSIRLFQRRLAVSKLPSSTVWWTYLIDGFSELRSIAFAILSKAFSMHRESSADVSSQGRLPDFLTQSFACYWLTCRSFSLSFLFPNTKKGKFAGSFGKALSRKFCFHVAKWSKEPALVMSYTRMQASAPL